MKTLKLKSIFFSLMAVGMVTLMCTSCDKDSEEDQPIEKVAETVGELPEKVIEQLDFIKTNLASKTGDQFKLLEYSMTKDENVDSGDKASLKTIDSETIAFGNIAEPNSIIFGSIDEVSPNNQVAKKSVDNYKSDLIKSTDQTIELRWEAKGKILKSICYYNNNGIVWDNVIFGLVDMDPKGLDVNEETQVGAKNAVLSKSEGLKWNIKWIWGGKRGEIGYRITIFYSNKTVSSTDRSDWGWMTAGSAKSESKITKNSGTHGKIQYALGWATPTASVSFDKNSFKVSVSGVGSKGVQNGTDTLYP